jgi:hypothetical protein
MVLEQRQDYRSELATMVGVASMVGFTAETF